MLERTPDCVQSDENYRGNDTHQLDDFSYLPAVMDCYHPLFRQGDGETLGRQGIRSPGWFFSARLCLYGHALSYVNLNRPSLPPE